MYIKKNINTISYETALLNEFYVVHNIITLKTII